MEQAKGQSKRAGARRGVVEVVVGAQDDDGDIQTRQAAAVLEYPLLEH